MDTWHGFSQGQTVYDNYLPSCKNPPLTRIQNALNQVILKKRYDVLSYNCQTTVNLACNNDPKSQSVDTWMPVLVAGMGVLVIGGILALFNE